jgi:hypothetical protein
LESVCRVTYRGFKSLILRHNTALINLSIIRLGTTKGERQ